MPEEAKKEEEKTAEQENTKNGWENIIVKTQCNHTYHHVCLQRLCCEVGPPKCPICRFDLRRKVPRKWCLKSGNFHEEDNHGDTDAADDIV